MENYEKNNSETNFESIGENFYFQKNVYPVNANRSHCLNRFTIVELNKRRSRAMEKKNMTEARFRDSHKAFLPR